MQKLKQILSKFLESFKIGGLAFILALLACLGGQGLKWLRRFVIPIILTILALIETHNLWCLLILSQIGILSIGYGISSLDDEGSFLGRFWYKIWKQNETLANIFTRGTIGFLLSLFLLILPIIKNNWLYYILGSLGIILVWALISWKGFGSFKVKIFNKVYECLKVDFITYSLTSLLELWIIFK